MNYLILGLFLTSAACALAQRPVSLEGNKMSLPQAAAEKSRIEAVTQEWETLKKNMTAINDEKDPQKRIALLKDEGQRLVDKGQKLVEKIKDLNITPESKQRLINLVSQSNDLHVLKGDWAVLKENLGKIAEEKDPKKRMAMMQEEGKRLTEKGKELYSKAKERASQFADIFKRKP